MNKQSIITAFLLYITVYTSHLTSCPACIGTVKKDSPLFFDDELYKKAPNHELSKHSTINTTQKNENPEKKDIQ